jgi:hypothetical protein
VRQDLHRRRRLLPQLQELLVALLDLLVKPVVLDLELLEIDQMQPVREPLLGADRSLEPLQRVPQDDVLQPLSVQDCLLPLLRGDELLDRRLRERLPGSRVLRRLGYLRVVPSFEATNVRVEFIGVRRS